MRTPIRILCLASVGLGIGLLACMLLRHWPLPEWAVRCRAFGRGEVSAWLESGGVRFDRPLPEVRRNKDGTGLVVRGLSQGRPVRAQIDLRDYSVRAWPAPAPVAFTGENGIFVAWESPSRDRVHFQAGDPVDLRPYALFDVDPEGRYFITKSGPSTTWIGRVNAPTERQLIEEDFRATCVFASERHVFVCGVYYPPDGNGLCYGRCLVLEDEGASFRRVEMHELPRGLFVVDKDPLGDRLLAVRDHDFLGRRMYGYDLATHVTTKLGPGNDYCVFVSDRVR